MNQIFDIELYAEQSFNRQVVIPIVGTVLNTTCVSVIKNGAVYPRALIKLHAN